MKEREKVLLSSILIISITAALVTAVSIAFLYRAAFERERARLLEIVRVQGRIIEAVADFDAKQSPDYPGGPMEATFKQIQEAYRDHPGSEKVEEFMVARREGGAIIVILHHHGAINLDGQSSIPTDSDFDEPLRLALEGQSGWWVGPYAGGGTVLAAYEPIKKLGVGLVAKTYLSEIRRPFIHAGIYAGAIIVLLVIAGSLGLTFITNPFIRRLEESEARYRSLIELSPDLVAVHTDGRFVYVNPAGAKLLGASSPNSLIGQPVLDFVHPDFHDFSKARMRQVLEQKKAPPLTEISMVGPDGHRSEVEITGTYIDYSGKPSVLLVARDITQRKLDAKEIERLNESLRSRINELQTIFEVAPIGLAIAEDPKGFHIRGNPTNERLLGLPSGAELSKRRSEGYKVVQEGLPLAVEELPMQRAVRGETVIGQLVEVVRKDGRIIRLHCNSTPLLDEKGKPRGAVGAFLDVTEWKRAEDDLRRSESRFRLLSNTAGLLLASADPQGVVNELCREVMEHLDCQVFFNFLRNEQAGKLHLNACAGIPEEEAEQIKWLDYGVAVCGCVARDGERIIAEDIFNTPDLRTDLVKSYGVQAYACHPLMVQGRIIGTLSFGTKNRIRFAPEDLALMKTVADQVATAMERMELVQELQKSQALLEQKVRERTRELEIANKGLQQVPAKLIAAQEEERKRLAAELHDSIGQTLAALKYGIETVVALRDRGNGEGALQQLDRFIPNLQRAIDETRAIYTGLRPKSLEEMGLVATLQWFCREFMGFYPKHHVELEVEIEEEPISETLKIAIFRIVQEALNNVAKHSKAEWVDLSLLSNGNGIELILADDGIGMDLRSIYSSTFAKTLGLTGMKERAELTGGSFSLESIPGEGTIVRVVWPLEMPHSLSPA